MILKNRLGKNKKLVMTNYFAKWFLIANCQLTIQVALRKLIKTFYFIKSVCYSWKIQLNIIVLDKKNLEYIISNLWKQIKEY